MNKTFTTGLVLGVVGVIAALAIWNTISISTMVSQDHATLGQIVQLINSNSQKQATTPVSPAAK